MPKVRFIRKATFSLSSYERKKKIAVWYEPIPDRHIDSDLALYRKQFGDSHFLAQPQRIKDWAEFKRRLTDLNERPESVPSLEEFARLKQGIQLANAGAYRVPKKSKTLNPITSLKTWASKLSGRTTLKTSLPSPSRQNQTAVDRKHPTATVNPITKLEQAISTWEWDQARLAIAIFSATIFNDPEPLEMIFGKAAKLENAFGRLTVGHLRILDSIMREITSGGESVVDDPRDNS